MIFQVSGVGSQVLDPHGGRRHRILLSTLPTAGKRSSGVRRLRLADLPPLRHAARACRRSRDRLACILILAALALAACGARGPEQPATGVAYAGPPVLNLRKDLASKSAAISTVKHGERLDVIEMRRRFVKVRTAQGVEGWTDSNLLLTEQQMEDLRQLAGAAAKLPSQGTATAFDALNMHATPSRQSPGFFQIAEGGAVEVIGHRVAPRTASSPQAQTPLPARRATVPKKAKGKEARASLGPPPA
ncbi:MAG: hypothetical protein DMG59_25085, partial [Acidobacteria bacterium]